MPFYGLIALARALFHSLKVQNSDVPPAIPDKASLLERVGYDRHAGPPYTEHLGKKLLGQREVIRIRKIAHP